MTFNNEFHDRGMKKWAGYFLSEHTAFLNKKLRREHQVYPPKRRMAVAEIEQVIRKAVIKNRPVAIQLEEVDENGHYYPDVCGLIQGGDELGLYVGTKQLEKVMFEEIRNIQIISRPRWDHVDFTESPPDPPLDPPSD